MGGEGNSLCLTCASPSPSCLLESIEPDWPWGGGSGPAPGGGDDLTEGLGEGVLLSCKGSLAGTIGYWTSSQQPLPGPCWAWPGSAPKPPRPSPEPSVEPSREPYWTWPGSAPKLQTFSGTFLGTLLNVTWLSTKASQTFSGTFSGTQQTQFLSVKRHLNVQHDKHFHQG